MDTTTYSRRALAVLLLGAVLAVLVIVPGGRAGAAVVGTVVSSWVTTPDRTRLLSPGPSAAFGTTGTPPGQVITVDPATSYQPFDGVGASITDSSAGLLYGLPQAQRDSVMRSLFSPGDGLGLSLLRQPIGASDFVDEPAYTYDDLPAGSTDLSMARFSIAHDEAQILPLLRQARALNPRLRIIASPWSPPAWMKTTGSLNGGRLKDDPAVFTAYARYLTRFVQAYRDAGVPIYALTVQNEPQYRYPNYPGADMPVAHQVRLINALGPMLRDAGLDTKIIGYDHNWTEHPADVDKAKQLGVDPEVNYPYDVLRSSAATWIAGTAYHCYWGDVSAQTALRNAFPDKGVWFTECSTFRHAGDSDAKYFADVLKLHGDTLITGVPRNWGRSVITWNVALDPAGNPHRGGCGDQYRWCTGVVTIDGTSVTRNPEFYTLGHLSRFVPPGAVRIGSTETADLRTVAFRNGDGTTSLVVKNRSTAAQTFAVSWQGAYVPYTIPAGALATLRWADGTPAIDPAAWYTVANIGSGKCVDATDFGTTDGTPLQQWRCGGTTNQQWQFRAAADGYVAVVDRQAPGLAWDVRGGTTAVADGTPVQLWSDRGTSNQQWRPEAMPDGSYRFVARSSGKCLDVTGKSFLNGARLQQWTCTGGYAQSFWLSRVL